MFRRKFPIEIACSIFPYYYEIDKDYVNVNIPRVLGFIQ